jgi:hypothetical protein
MYTLIRRAGVREAALIEAPSFAVSFILAEVFYKFHSFALECLAFLATWFVISGIVGIVTRPWFKSDSR